MKAWTREGKELAVEAGAVDMAEADTRESMTDPREGMGEGVALLMTMITRTLSRTDCL